MANVDFSAEKVEKEKLEEERIRRWQAEVKIYFHMKEFIMVMNQNPPSVEYCLKMIASGYREIKKEYEIVFYSADQWNNNMIHGISKVIEEKWTDELKMKTNVDYNLLEIERKKLYLTTFTIKSDHVVETDLELFYYHKIFLAR